MPGVVAVITATELDGIVGPLRVEAPGSPTTCVPCSMRSRTGRSATSVIRSPLSSPRTATWPRMRAMRSRSTTSLSTPWSRWTRRLILPSRRCSRMSAPTWFYTEAMNFGEPDVAFAEADRVVSAMIDSARVTHVPMEGRGGVADYAPEPELIYQAARRRLTRLRQAWSPCSSRRTTGCVWSSPTSAGRSGRSGLSREDLAVCAAARSSVAGQVGRGPGRESSPAGRRGRKPSRSVAVKEDGTTRGLGVKMRSPGRLPDAPNADPSLPGWIVRTTTGTAYRIDTGGVADVTPQQGSYSAYRGPWASETWHGELSWTGSPRAGDRSGGGPPPEPVQARGQPCEMMTGPTIDGRRGSRHAGAGASCRLRRIPRRAARARDGRHLASDCRRTSSWRRGRRTSSGDRVTICSERAIVGSSPTAIDGVTSQSPHGQGHETTLTQIVASEFGWRSTHVRVLTATRHGPYSSTAPAGRGGHHGQRRGPGREAQRQTEVLAIVGNMLEIYPTTSTSSRRASE